MLWPKNTDKWRAKYANYLPRTLQETGQQQRQRQQQQQRSSCCNVFRGGRHWGKCVTVGCRFVALSLCRLSRVVYVAAAMNE